MGWRKEARRVAALMMVVISGCSLNRVSVGSGARQVAGRYGNVTDGFVLPLYGVTLGGEVDLAEEKIEVYTEVSGFELRPNKKVIEGVEIDGSFWSLGAGIHYYPWDFAFCPKLVGFQLGGEVFHGEYQFKSFDPWIGFMPIEDGDSFWGAGLKLGLVGEPEFGQTGWRLGWHAVYNFTVAEKSLAEVDLDGWQAGFSLQIPLGR
ncbi:MAG: hypothetical protein AAB589_02555 [Patescibacteria group bacterium]